MAGAVAFLEALKDGSQLLASSEQQRQRDNAVPHFRTSVDLLNQLCTSRSGLTHSWESHDRGMMLHYIAADCFRIDIVAQKDTVLEAQIQHHHKNASEPCPELAMSLRCKDTSWVDRNVSGFMELYPQLRDRNHRIQLARCLDMLDKDLNALHIQADVQGSDHAAVQLANNGPFGLICPRREGFPTCLGFFVAPRDLVRKGTVIKDLSYTNIAAQKLGSWVSLGIEASFQAYKLPRQPLFGRKADNSDSIGDVSDASHAELPGFYCLKFEKELIVFEDTLHEIFKLTGIQPVTNPSCRGRLLWDNWDRLPNESTLSGPKFYVRLPGQHQSYDFDESLPLTDKLQKIPFTNPHQIPLILNILRKQAAMNELLLGCIRPTSKTDVVSPFEFSISLTDIGILVEFNHPLNASFCKVEVSLQDPVLPLVTSECQPALATNERMTEFLQKSFSIPAMLKSSIDHFVSSYKPPPVPITSFPPDIAPSPINRSESVIEIPFTPLRSISVPDASNPDGAGVPQAPPMGVQISPTRFAKIESILAGGQKALKPSVKTELPMDQSEHADRLKQLYEANQKKLAKAERRLDAGGNKIKVKKRKVLSDTSPSGSAEPMAKYSAQIRPLDDSPHGSPLTVKFSKQPSGMEASPVAATSKEPMPKKKKQKMMEMINPMPSAPGMSKVPMEKTEKKAKPNPSELEALLMKKKAPLPVGSPNKANLSKSPSLASVLNASTTKNQKNPTTTATSPRSLSAAPKFGSSKSNPGSTTNLSKPQPSKSPTATPAAPPLFNVPKMPSLSSLPRIPKKSATAATTPPVSAAKAPVFQPIPGMSAADLAAMNEISALISNPSLGRPTPLVAPAGSASTSKSTGSIPSPVVAEKMHGIPPPLPEISVESQKNDEEKKDGALESPGPLLGKTKGKSLSSVLERLKNRSKPDPSDSSHDSTDSGFDTAGRGASGSAEPLEGLVSEGRPDSSNAMSADQSNEEQRGPSASGTDGMQVLVPYGDEDSLDRPEGSGNEPILNNGLPEGSPEIMDPRQTQQRNRPIDSVTPEPSGSENQIEESSVQRTSPVIMDDALFDAAFFTSDEGDG